MQFKTKKQQKNCIRLRIRSIEDAAVHSRGYEVVVVNTDYRSKQLRARIVSCVEGRGSIRMREVKVQIGNPE